MYDYDLKQLMRTSFPYIKRGSELSILKPINIPQVKTFDALLSNLSFKILIFTSQKYDLNLYDFKRKVLY